MKYNHAVINSEINIEIDNEMDLINAFWTLNSKIIGYGALCVGVVTSGTELISSSLYYKNKMFIKTFVNIPGYVKINIETIQEKNKLVYFFKKYYRIMELLNDSISHATNIDRIYNIISITTYLDKLPVDNQLEEVYIEKNREQIYLSSIMNCPYTIYTHIRKYKHKKITPKRFLHNMMSFYKEVQRENINVRDMI